MAASDDLIESLRFHLGYGCLSEDGPYTADGFRAVFYQVIQPNLTAGAETTSTTTVSEAGLATITVGSLTGIAAHSRLVVDVGDATEIVVVRATGVLALTATFALPHTQPYPVAVLGGEQRLRLLLHRADASWQAMQSGDVGDVAGLKRIEGDVEWFPGGNTLRERTKAYEAVVNELSILCRVESLRGRRCSGQLEAY
jgi:hypothetical protein